MTVPNVLRVAALLACCSAVLGASQRASGKTGRNVPVGGDIKASVNFDCPEEFGYYPHPSDCTQYYVCVFGGALLESCTGGLMYSHELQTCDWPRNVGCEGLAEVAAPAPSTSSSGSSGSSSRVPESRSRYNPPPPPPPAQPAAVVTSRGQPKQLHHTQQEIIKQKQQQQLYADAEESLPIAEEIESDRQQRVYRGQPSTVGQVQRDRDGLRHSNAIPSYSGRGEKIGVISFGTQQQPLQQYSSVTDVNELTNDLTVERSERRKRQTQLSNGSSTTTWTTTNSISSTVTPIEQKPTTISYLPVKQASYTVTNRVSPTTQKTEVVSVFQPLVPYNFSSFHGSTEDPFKQFDSLYPTESSTQAAAASKNSESSTQKAAFKKSAEALATTTPDYWTAFHSSQAVEESKTSQTTAKPIDETHAHTFPYSHFTHSWTGFTDGKKDDKKAAQQTTKADPYHSTDPFDYSAETLHKEAKTYASVGAHYKPITTSAGTTQKPKKKTQAKQEDAEGHATNDEESEEPEEEKKPAPHKKTEKDEDEDASVAKSKFSSDEDKFEDIENPFADPNFDFDKYLQSLKSVQESRAAAQNAPRRQQLQQGQYLQPRPLLPRPIPVRPQPAYSPRPIIRNDPASVEPRGINMETQTYHSKIEIKSEKHTMLDGEDDRPEKRNEVNYSKKPQSRIDNGYTSYAAKSPNTELVPPKLPGKLNRYPLPNYNPTERGPQTFSSLGSITGAKVAQNLPYNNVKPPQLVPKAPYAQVKPGQVPPKAEYYYYDDEVTQNPKKAVVQSNKEPLYEEYYEYYEYPEETVSNGTQAAYYYDDVVPKVQPRPVHYQNVPVPSKPVNNYQRIPVAPKYNSYQSQPIAKYENKYSNNHVPRPTTKAPPKPIVKQQNQNSSQHVDDEDEEAFHENYEDFPVYTPKYYKSPSVNSSKYFEDLLATITTSSRPLPTYPESARFTATIRTTVKPTTKADTRHRHSSTSRHKDNDSEREKSNNRVEENGAQQQSVSTATARTLYNSSRYEPNHYDPYYALYDDDSDLYRDVDYQQHYNNNNNAAQQQTPSQSYRGTPPPSVQQSTSVDTPKRGSTSYIQSNNYNSPQDVYQQSTLDYNDDNYNTQVDQQSNYRQSSRQPLRGDRNELSYVEEPTSIPKRITTTSTKSTTTKTTTTTTTPRPSPVQKSTVPSRNWEPPRRQGARIMSIDHQQSSPPDTAKANQTRAQSIINTLSEDPEHNPSIEPITTHPESTDRQNTATETLDPVTYKYDTKNQSSTDAESEFSLHVPIRAAVSQPAPFSLPKHLTTEKPPSFHYITKNSKFTQEVHEKSSTLPATEQHDQKLIIPTTYSPPKFFLKSILPKPLTTPFLSDSYVFNLTPANLTGGGGAIPKEPIKTLKSVRKIISTTHANDDSYSSTEADVLNNHANKEIVSSVHFGIGVPNYRHSSPVRTKHEPDLSVHVVNTESLSSSTEKSSTTTETATKPTTTTSATVTTITSLDDRILTQHDTERIRNYLDQTDFYQKKPFRNTVEIPPADQLIHDPEDLPKTEPDQPPSYKIQPNPKLTTPADILTQTVADAPRNVTTPARLSRVNTAIKSLIAFGGARRPNTKCYDNNTPNVKCNNETKQRTNTRGRGSAHYSSTGTVSPGDSSNVNRGTPAPRSRPTLKPSTSIVAKASEFVDIYRYPPRRPDPLYPQPQPDKTAAKCRKDVCLLPDCSCGGKEVPGDLPVEQVPQIVLLTFDDSVNDLNKGLYHDLFEKGRVNPNGCPISATFYVSHEWTDYSQVQNLYSDGHEIASHTVSHSFGEQFSQKKWTKEVAGQREILAAYGGVHLEDVRGMRAPFLSVGGNKMFKMLYDSNFTYDSSMPIYENKPPSWPYTLDYKLFHDCMIPPCPTRSYPGVWEVPMVMWQDLNGGRCSMGDACSNPADAEGVFKMLMKNFERHYTTNRAPFGLFYHAAWFTQPHHKDGFIQFLDTINAMKDVWLVTNWQAIQWVRDPTPLSRINSFPGFQCNYSDRPKRCNNPKVCNLWHKSGVRYMRTCQPCPDIYPWTGNTGIRSSKIDNDIED